MFFAPEIPTKTYLEAPRIIEYKEIAAQSPQIQEFEPEMAYPTISTSTPLISQISWYDYGLENEPDYSKKNLTCAARDWPKGSVLLIKYKNKSVICRVNDWVENPEVILDLSSYAFGKLADLKLGILEVEISDYKCSCVNLLRYKGVPLPPAPLNADELKPNTSMGKGKVVLQKFSNGIYHAGLVEKITNDGLLVKSWNKTKCQESLDLVKWGDKSLRGFYQYEN